MFKKIITTAIILLITTINTCTFASGPLLVDENGQILSYGSRPLIYRLDRGNLGIITNSQALSLFDEVFSGWNNVSTSTFMLSRDNPGLLDSDITPSNAEAILAPTVAFGYTPVIFDTDGGIVESVFGSGASNAVLGFAGPSFAEQHENGEVFIVESVGLLNGKFVNGIDNSNDFEVPVDALKGTVLHEFGHALGLDHSQINPESLAKGASIETRNSVPLMFPVSVNDLFEVKRDDKSGISFLYPNTSQLSGFGTIKGKLLRGNGMTPVLGANIIAKNTSSPKLEAVSSASDYKGQKDGAYILFGILPGSYKLEIQPILSLFTGGSSVGHYSDDEFGASFRNPVPRGFYQGAGLPLTSDESKAKILTVNAGQTIDNLDVIASFTLSSEEGGCCICNPKTKMLDCDADSTPNCSPPFPDTYCNGSDVICCKTGAMSSADCQLSENSCTGNSTSGSTGGSCCQCNTSTKKLECGSGSSPNCSSSFPEVFCNGSSVLCCKTGATSSADCVPSSSNCSGSSSTSGSTGGCCQCNTSTRKLECSSGLSPECSSSFPDAFCSGSSVLCCRTGATSSADCVPSGTSCSLTSTSGGSTSSSTGGAGGCCQCDSTTRRLSCGSGLSSQCGGLRPDTYCNGAEVLCCPPNPSGRSDCVNSVNSCTVSLRAKDINNLSEDPSELIVDTPLPAIDEDTDNEPVCENDKIKCASGAPACSVTSPFLLTPVCGSALGFSGDLAGPGCLSAKTKSFVLGLVSCRSFQVSPVEQDVKCFKGDICPNRKGFTSCREDTTDCTCKCSFKSTKNGRAPLCDKSNLPKCSKGKTPVCLKPGNEVICNDGVLLCGDEEKEIIDLSDIVKCK